MFVPMHKHNEQLWWPVCVTRHCTRRFNRPVTRWQRQDLPTTPKLTVICDKKKRPMRRSSAIQGLLLLGRKWPGCWTIFCCRCVTLWRHVIVFSINGTNTTHLSKLLLPLLLRARLILHSNILAIVDTTSLVLLQDSYHWPNIPMLLVC